MKKQSFKEIFFEIVRFLLVGGLATLTDYAVFYVFNLVILKDINPNWNLMISTALGFITGFFVNWFLQAFVYKNAHDKLKSKRVFLRFTIVSLLGLGITELGMFLAKPTFTMLDLTIFGVTFSFWKLFFKVLMTGIVLVWNYLARKYYVFGTFLHIFHKKSVDDTATPAIEPTLNEEPTGKETEESVENKKE